MNVQTLPLSSLALSALNVRKTERDAFIESLADDIAARGLKQNLIVVPNGKADRYEVVAGGRRFQAMQLLVKRGDMKKDAPIAVIIEAKADGVETSLSENLHRVAMNPADEFLAYKTVIADMAGTDDERVTLCAKRFGQTELHVRGRLRLASLAEPILEALRTDVIGIQAAMAYASVDNQVEQERVFKENSKPNAWNPHDPKRVRDELAKRSYAVTDPKVKFVGLEAYKEAGGRTDIDLFTTDATERLIDPSIVDKLLTTTFEKIAPKLAKKMMVAGVVLDLSPYGNGGPAPKGWESAYLAEDARKKRIAEGLPMMLPLRLNTDGKPEHGRFNNYVFVPKVEKEAQPERQGHVPETDEQRAERARKAHISLEALRLAFPKCAGTELEGRVFFPRIGSWCRTEQDEDGEQIYVEVKVRISKAEYEAQLDQAAVVYDAWLVDEAQRKAQAEADRAALIAEIIANPPAVVCVNRTDYFQWADGSYASEREADVQDDDDYFETGTLDEILANAGRGEIATYATIEEYDAACADDIPEDM